MLLLPILLLVAACQAQAASIRRTMPLGELLNSRHTLLDNVLDRRADSGNASQAVLAKGSKKMVKLTEVTDASQLEWRPRILYSSTTQNVGLCNPGALSNIVVNNLCGTEGDGCADSQLEASCSYWGDLSDSVRLNPDVGHCIATVDADIRLGLGKNLRDMLFTAFDQYTKHAEGATQQQDQSAAREGWNLTTYSMPQTIRAELDNLVMTENGTVPMRNSYMQVSVTCQKRETNDIGCAILKGFLDVLVGAVSAVLPFAAPAAEVAITAGTAAASAVYESGKDSIC